MKTIIITTVMSMIVSMMTMLMSGLRRWSGQTALSSASPRLRARVERSSRWLDTHPLGTFSENFLTTFSQKAAVLEPRARARIRKKEV